jgi:hypothetical protein
MNKIYVNNLKNCCILIVFCIFISSCATIFGSRYEIISVDSKPRGADVYVFGKFVGVTPTKVKVLKSSQSVIFDIIKLDHKPERFTLYNKRTNPSRSVLCMIDYNLGWFLLGIPILIDKDFSYKCRFFYKNNFVIELKKEEINKTT